MTVVVSLEAKGKVVTIAGDSDADSMTTKEIQRRYFTPTIIL